MSTTASQMRCLCGNTREPGSLLSSSSFPIETEICHCNPCRQTSGSLGLTCAELKGSPSSDTMEKSTRYLPPGAKIAKYHCSTCGTRTFDYSTRSGLWFACSGIIEHSATTGDKDNNEQKPPTDTVKITKHEFVGDTGDGGLARLLPRIGGRDVPSYPEREDAATKMSEHALNTLYSSSSSTTERADKLHASCHCGSIQFDILPPPPDSMHRPPSVTRWLRADGTKYWALICACNYCRWTFGAMSMAFNTYVMPECIVVPDNQDKDPGAATTTGPTTTTKTTTTQTAKTQTQTETQTYSSPFPYTSHSPSTGSLQTSMPALQSHFPVLKAYFTTPSTRRTFCGVCGASIFFERESRPQCVNVAAGILRAESGVLAQDWVEWETEVWFKEEAVDREVVRGWVEGWKGEIGERRGG